MDAPAPLILACPQCGTRFRVAPELLDVAEGYVRCGACLTVFDGRAEDAGGESVAAHRETAGVSATGADVLLDLPARMPEIPRPGTAREHPSQVDAPAPLPPEPSLPERPELERPVDPGLLSPPTSPAPLGGTRPVFAESAAGAMEEERRAPLPPEARPKPASSPQARMGARAALAASALPKTTPAARPSNAAGEEGVVAAPARGRQSRREGRANPRPGAAGPFFAVLALLAALVFGVFALRLDAWSLRPELRTAYEVACDLIGCRVPSPNMPTAWDLNTKAVARPGPPEPITLEVELVNNAPYRQALPTVAVRLTGDGDELVAQERLTPRDYAPERPTQRMAPGKPKALLIQVPDPGAEATSYRIALL